MQLPGVTIIYKIITYYFTSVTATRRINRIMSKWIFNYNEVI